MKVKTSFTRNGQGLGHGTTEAQSRISFRFSQLSTLPRSSNRNYWYLGGTLKNLTI
uniref:hypothetical protein n=1 Tax=Mariniflexile sp. TaxID=1979402 RepID=UPI004047A17D